MSDTASYNGNFTSEPVEKVFASVVDGLTKTFKNTHPAEDVAHLATLVDSVKGNPQWKGVSADFIRYGITSHIEQAAKQGKGEFSLASLTADTILSSLRNHGGPNRPQPVVRDIRVGPSVTMLGEYKEKLQEKLQKPRHPLAQQDAVWVGIYSLMAGMSLYEGIVRGVRAMNSPQQGDEPRPFMPYMLSAAQVAIGVGMAVLAHNHYQTATRGH